MKASEMVKDERISIRLNSKVRNLLRQNEISTQKLFDQAIDKTVKVVGVTKLKLNERSCK